MFRPDRPLTLEKNCNFVLTHAALGDMIASLPAVRYARKVRPSHTNVIVWVPEHQMALVSHLLGAETEAGKSIYVLPLHLFKEIATSGDERQDKIAGVAMLNSVFKETVTRNKIDLVAYGYLTLIDRLMIEPAELNYPSAPLGPRTINEPYVVLPVNGTTINKTPPASWIEAMIQWCVTAGYKPVVTGKKDTIVKVIGDDKPVKVLSHFDDLHPDIRALTLDTRDTLSLLEARDVCGYARAVAGFDGGTIHLAATTDVPIVYGLTTTIPEHRYVYRHSELNWRLRHTTPRNLTCAGCQSNWDLAFGYNFRDCAYGDNICVDHLNPDDFIDGLKSLGL
jgi:ADP-heptose:LPS heptosyltransferase